MYNSVQEAPSRVGSAAGLMLWLSKPHYVWGARHWVSKLYFFSATGGYKNCNATLAVNGGWQTMVRLGVTMPRPTFCRKCSRAPLERASYIMAILLISRLGRETYVRGPVFKDRVLGGLGCAI